MKFSICIIVFLSFTAEIFAQNNMSEIQQMNQIIKNLIDDSNHQFLKTLAPQEADFSEIFTSKEIAEKVMEYSNSKWVGIENVPDGSMKPTNEVFQTKVLQVSKAELEKGHLNGFPEDYLILSNYLKDGVTMFGLQYLNEDDSEQKTRAAFFNVNNRWIVIPQPFKVLPN